LLLQLWMRSAGRSLLLRRVGTTRDVYLVWSSPSLGRSRLCPGRLQVASMDLGVPPEGVSPMHKEGGRHSSADTLLISMGKRSELTADQTPTLIMEVRIMDRHT
jgi:hypothetical protein